MSKIINYFVILCGLMGLYLSCIGLQQFPDKRSLFIITFCASLLAILIGIFEIFTFRKKIDFKIIKIIFSILSSIILIFGGLYILFFMHTSFIMSGIVTFAIIFFLIAVIKGTLKLFKGQRPLEDKGSGLHT